MCPLLVLRVAVQRTPQALRVLLQVSIFASTGVHPEPENHCVCAHARIAKYKNKLRGNRATQAMYGSKNFVQERIQGSQAIKHAHQTQAARKTAGPHSGHPVNAAIEQTRCVGIYAASRRSCAARLHRNARVLPQGLSLAARRRPPAPETCGCGLVCCRPLPRPPVLELRLLQLDYCRCCARGCSHRTACAEAADDTMRLNQLPQAARSSLPPTHSTDCSCRAVLVGATSRSLLPVQGDTRPYSQ